MEVELGARLREQYDTLDERIQSRLKDRLKLFKKDPENPVLRNHELKEKWQGYRSIDITGDYRAIFKEVGQEEGKFAFFVALGNHKELYQQN